MFSSPTIGADHLGGRISGRLGIYAGDYSAKMGNENDILAQLRGAAEQLQHVDRAFRQFDQHYGESVRRATEQWRSYESDIIAQAQRAVERFHREIGDQARDTLAAQLRQFETLVEPVRVLGRDLERHAHWQSLLQPEHGIRPHLPPLPSITSQIIAQAEAARDGIIKAILEQTSEARLWATDPALGTRMHAIPAAYASFCEATINELANYGRRSSANQLLGSIKLAQTHVQEVCSIPPPISVEEGAVHGTTIRPASIRVYAVQRAELSTVEILDPQDIGELRAKSPTAVGASRVSQMLKLVAEVNTAAKLSGITEIFRPTAMLLAFAELPGIVTSNQTSFGDFIDRLFWIFYEGAGSNSLRYLTGNGGPLDAADCDAIWAIKTLRNKWYRHDPDHGSPGDIRRSYKALAATLARFGLRTFPDSAKDHTRIRTQLIEDLVVLLQKLRDRLT